MHRLTPPRASIGLALSLPLSLVSSSLSVSCHAGHELVEAAVSAFYCECGLHTDTCRCLKGRATGAMECREEGPTASLVPSSAPSLSSSPLSTLPFPSSWLPMASVQSTVDALRSAASASGRAWEDPSFPHSTASLFLDPSQPSQPSWLEAEWRRVVEVFPSPTLFAPPLSSDDVQQGSLGNCWFLSALAVLTLHEQLVFARFLTPQLDREAGVYAVHFFRDGEERAVIVDDYIPCMRGEVEGSWTPLFAQAREGRDVWALLLEKAFAKLYGCYAAIEGGWVDDALMDLTGGVSERLSFGDAEVKTAAYDGSLFQRCLHMAQSGFLLGCGSPTGSSDREEDASGQGIVQSHAYSVLGLVEADGHQLIHLRNPWGRKEWTGDWSDSSPLWTERMKAKVGGLRVQDDGQFWMSWTDFVHNFDELYTCRLYSPERFPCRGQLDGRWDERTAGGCCNHPSVERNTQFALQAVDGGDVDVCVELCQRDSRGRSTAPLPIVILELYDNDAQPVTQSRRGQLKANKGASALSIHLATTLSSQGAHRVYTLLPCTYQPDTFTSYTLRWMATKEVHVTQLGVGGAQPPIGKPSTAADAAQAPQPSNASTTSTASTSFQAVVQADDRRAKVEEQKENTGEADAEEEKDGSSSSQSPFFICDDDEQSKVPSPASRRPLRPTRRPLRVTRREDSGGGQKEEEVAEQRRTVDLPSPLPAAFEL